MKKLTDAEFKEALEKHRKYLTREKGGERFAGAGLDLYSADLRSANLYGANLYSANLYGADLGSKTELGRKLRLIGACMDATAWVDNQEDQSDPQKLFAEAKEEWKAWLCRALGGEPTMQRLDAVVDYITKGSA